MKKIIDLSNIHEQSTSIHFYIHQISPYKHYIYIHITIVISRDFSMFFHEKRNRQSHAPPPAAGTRSVGSTNGSAQSDSCGAAGSVSSLDWFVGVNLTGNPWVFTPSN